MLDNSRGEREGDEGRKQAREEEKAGDLDVTGGCIVRACVWFAVTSQTKKTQPSQGKEQTRDATQRNAAVAGSQE